MTISAKAAIFVASVLTAIVSVAVTLDVTAHLTMTPPAPVATYAPPVDTARALQQAAQDLQTMTQGRVTQRL
jgi:hypothetical protein